MQAENLSDSAEQPETTTSPGAETRHAGSELQILPAASYLSTQNHPDGMHTEQAIKHDKIQSLYIIMCPDTDSGGTDTAEIQINGQTLRHLN